MGFCNKNKIFSLLVCASVAVAASGCSKVQKELGIGRHSPDEFAVVKRAPLSLPPEYDLLPPDPDQQAYFVDEEKDGALKAKSVVFGEDALSDKNINMSSEENLLQNVGISDADPDIRKTIDRETGYVILSEDKDFSKKIMFWQESGNEEESIIDAVKENERLQKNIEENNPVTGGETPVIEKKKGVIDKIF